MHATSGRPSALPRSPAASSRRASAGVSCSVQQRSISTCLSRNPCLDSMTCVQYTCHAEVARMVRDAARRHGVTGTPTSNQDRMQVAASRHISHSLLACRALPLPSWCPHTPIPHTIRTPNHHAECQGGKQASSVPAYRPCCQCSAGNCHGRRGLSTCRKPAETPPRSL